MSEEYMDFDKVLSELEMDEEELKKLVSAGEIRAFREDNQMKFKKDEIEKLKDKKGSEPDVIDILDSDSLEPDGDLTEELEFSADFDDADDLSGDDLISEEIGDDTEEIDLGAIEEEEEVVTAPAATRSSRVVGKSKIAAMSEEPEEETPGWAVGLMAVATVACILAFIVMLDSATGNPSGLTKWLVEMTR